MTPPNSGTPPQAGALRPLTDRVGQGTVVEASRATAEVLGGIEAAQRWPRDVQESRRELTIACGMMSVAEHAFYSFPQAGKTVEGSTVALARTLALAWGHVHFGITELRRDDDYGQSEIQSWAWDVQRGVRSARVFILPHRIYTKKHSDRLVDLREIQLNNLSVGGRNVRETLFAVIPAWFREEGEKLCRATLVQGEIGPDGARKGLPPLPIRIGNLLDWYHSNCDVTEAQLVAKVGRSTSRWSVHDVVALGTLSRSLSAGEIQVADAFPAPILTAAAVMAAAPPSEETTDDDDDE